MYINDYIKIFMRSEKIGEQITSIQKLLELDFDVLFCNHNPQLKNGKEKLRNKLQFLQDFYGKVRNEHEKGLSVNEIMKALDLKENYFAKAFSLGELSRVNMVKSVIDSLSIERANLPDH